MTPLDDNPAVRQVGNSLVDFSRHARTSARGLITALFPYILTASKRMSTRAISAFLQQEHQVNISAATIAKALREPEKHLWHIYEVVDPASRLVATALGLEVSDLLTNEDLFRASADKPPALDGTNNQEIGNEYDLYMAARHHLENYWYSIDGAVRSMVLAEIEKADADEAETSENGESNE